MSHLNNNTNSTDNQINNKFFRNILQHLNKDLDLIQYANPALNEYLINCSRMISGVFCIEYLYSGLKSLYYNAYTDMAVNFFITLIFYGLIKFKLTTKINIIRILIYSFILLTFYQSSYYGVYAGVQYNTLNLFLVIPYTFDIRKNLKEIILILLLCLGSFAINYFTDFSLFASQHNTLKAQNEIFYSQIIILIFNFAFFIYIILQGTKLLFLSNVDKNITTEKKTHQSDASSKKIKDLEHLAMSSPGAFIIKFNEIFPSFYSSLQNRFPDLSKGEIELCCYLKLNFSTKEIAIATNRSIRSIDSKKYRLRKKLNLDSSEKIYQFFISNEEF